MRTFFERLVGSAKRILEQAVADVFAMAIAGLGGGLLGVAGTMFVVSPSSNANHMLPTVRNPDTYLFGAEFVREQYEPNLKFNIEAIPDSQRPAAPMSSEEFHIHFLQLFDENQP